MYELAPFDRCSANADRIAKAWSEEVAAANANSSSLPMEEKTSLWRMLLWRAYGHRLGALALLKLVAILASYAAPLALEAVITSVDVKEGKRATRARLTFTYAVILFVFTLASAALDSHYSYAIQRVATQQRLGLQRFLFVKAMRLSGKAKQHLGVGAIVSHLQMDCRIIAQGVVYVNMSWGVNVNANVND